MDNDVSKYALVGALAIIMYGMGLDLTKKDFTNIFNNPKALTIGVISQVVLLPVIAYLLCLLLPVSSFIAVGIMLLAACPGGASSNLITNLAKGDVALSVSLTTITSFITIFTIPSVVNFAIDKFASSGERIEHLDVVDTIKQIFIIIVIPVSLGMITRKYNKSFAEKMMRPVKIGSAILLVVIILGVIIKERESIANYIHSAGLIALLLNVLTMIGGYGLARLFSVSTKQSMTIMIETGIQNAALAIIIAVNLLGNSQYAVSAAVYSIVMFITAGIVIYYGNRKT